jgi:putative acetyltransferase
MYVRPYRTADAAAIASVFTDSVRSASKDYSPEQIVAWGPDPPDVEHWRTRIAIRIGFVAEAESFEQHKGEIAGSVTLERDGHLDDLYVAPRFQRRGVAAMLYSRVEQEAQSRHLSRIFTEASITARPFFESAGFSVVSAQTVKLRGVSFTNYRMEGLLRLSQ